jgi:serine/threonine protein kinase/WD40 repeat protein
MSTSSDERNPVERLAEEFADRYRRGEQPSLTEYTARYPQWADEIRELFPALILVEQFKPAPGEHTGPYQPPAGAGAPPARLGDYRLLRKLGEGGMGVVYEAEQESLSRHVALKVLAAHLLSNDTARERFKREAQAAARLHHTNIVPVFGVGEAGGAHFYAMQYIPGYSLDRVLDDLRHLRKQGPNGGPDHGCAAVARSLLTGEGPRQEATQLGQPADAAGPEASASATAPSAVPAGGSSATLNGPASGNAYHRGVARIGLQAAEALAYAHRQGVLHRDVKPSNLLPDPQGTVWVTDFGLAKLADTSDLTNTDELVGTLRYMAPERFQRRCDARSDVYALGLTLYELLALRPAFAGADRVGLIDRVLHEEPAPLRRLDPLVPRDLETVVRKAMAKEPADRYASAADLAEDLRRFLGDRPIKARRTPSYERLWRWCRRNPAVATLLATVGALLLLLALGTSLANVRMRALYAESQRNLFQAYRDQARAGRRSRQMGQRFDGLAAITKAARIGRDLRLPEDAFRDLRNEAIACLLLPDFAVEKEWEGAPVGSSNPAFDATFERYARGDKDGNVSIRRVADDQELLTLPGAGPVADYAGLAFSPDGRFLFQTCETARGRRSRLWRLDGTKPVALLDDDHDGLTFRPDGRECAVSYPDGSIRVCELPTGKERRRWQLAFPDPSPGLLWNPKRPLLLAFSPKAVWVLNAETGQVVWRLSEGGLASWADWHPEGRLLGVANHDNKIRLWDLETRQMVLPPLEGHKATGGVILRFDPSGERLLSTDWSHMWRLWDAQTGRQLLAFPAWGTCLQFNAGGTLAAADKSYRRSRFFRYRSGHEFRTLIPRRGPRREAAGWGRAYVALGPQGRLLAVSAQDGVAVLDIARGTEAGLLPLTGNVPLAFEPSGALLTNGSSGLLRWPVAVNAGTGQRGSGPPERLYPPTGLEVHGASADGRVVAIPNYDSGAIVLHRDGNRTVRLGPQQAVRCCAVSPDGRWVATGSHDLSEGAGAKVWDARTGAHVADLPVGGLCRVGFSPDGKWLATNSGGPRLWEVGNWRPRPVGGSETAFFAFSPNSQLVAATDDPGIVRLTVPQTGKELARLAAPVDERLLPCCFTPDGTRLITLGEDRAVHVFDLAAIRRQLREIDLDWDMPPYPPRPAEADQPQTVTFDLGRAKTGQARP